MSSTQSVRALYVPVEGPSREDVVPVVDGKIDLKSRLGEETVARLLPDQIYVISRADLERRRESPRVIAGYNIHGDFYVTRLDSTCTPVGLTDDQVVFYGDAVKLPSRQPLGPTRVVYVADVDVTYRAVTIPAVCECGADLTREGAVDAWRYQDEGQLARLPRHAGEEDNLYYSRGVIISDNGRLKGGEGFIDNVALVCVACSKMLAEGRERVYNDPNAVPQEKENNDQGTDREPRQSSGEQEP